MLREGNIDAHRRFADEGRLLANLRDPHLVRVLAVGMEAGALVAPHRIGIIHRDVKPSNIVQLDGDRAAGGETD